jgi:hypothetical protein
MRQDVDGGRSRDSKESGNSRTADQGAGGATPAGRTDPPDRSRCRRDRLNVIERAEELTRRRSVCADAGQRNKAAAVVRANRCDSPGPSSCSDDVSGVKNLQRLSSSGIAAAAIQRVGFSKPHGKPRDRECERRPSQEMYL